jgi:hypothetical protein
MRKRLDNEGKKWMPCLGHGLLAKNCRKKILTTKYKRLCDHCTETTRGRYETPAAQVASPFDGRLGLGVDGCGMKPARRGCP